MTSDLNKKVSRFLFIVQYHSPVIGEKNANPNKSWYLRTLVFWLRQYEQAIRRPCSYFIGAHDLGFPLLLLNENVLFIL